MPPTAVLGGQRAMAGSISDLPAEVLLEICGFTTVAEHDKFSRTCWYFTSVLQKDLFKRSAGDHCGAIRYGCEKGNIPIIRRSLDYGFPPDIDDIIDHKIPRHMPTWEMTSMPYTALGVAIDGQYAQVVDYLMSRGASQVHGPNYRISPLLRAIEAGAEDVVLVLLKRGVSPNIVATRDVQAPYSGDCTALIENIQELEGAACNEYMDDSICRSIVDSRMNIFNHLFDFGADPNWRDGDGYTPLEEALHFLVWGRYEHDTEISIKLVRMPLNHGADPNLASAEWDKVSPFSQLVGCRSWDYPSFPPQVRLRLMEMMIQAGANLTAVNTEPPYFDQTVLTRIFSDSYRTYNLTRDYQILAGLYEEQAAKPQHVGARPDDRISLQDVLNDEQKWVFGTFPVLLKAGAKISRRDLDMMEEKLERLKEERPCQEEWQG
ncbi:hypothetical protein CONLIGDRAFT_693403 [Coniochaeta ligniaria NRRL 30616]|uniref:Uncharacterized protein n=1 Tax=Coniochaeta ligniaria NRRL 30616 TaxID=1408157 RepID=A0A1J7I7Y7_9PEZI|nr:hypothetical protein CONLIGDRAFT_693403 [Coniochaeta ligniaria NRRL 30616]